MLRVYSIFYIEKLWKPDPNPVQRQVVSTYSSPHTTSVPFVEQGETVANEGDEGVIESRQIIEDPEQVIEVEYEEQPETIENEPEVMALIVEEDEDEEEEEEVEYEEEEELDQPQEQEQELQEDKEENKLDNKRDSKMSADVSQVITDESIVKNLTIDTKQKEPEDKKDLNTVVEEIFEEPAVITASLSSASSSLVPPATPDSTHSSTNNERLPPTSPRTTSLIRRETSKFNDRRKSLTKKLKKALSTSNKRNSV